MASSDDLLLDAWRANRDPDAFAEILKRHAGMVHGTCRRILRNDADAEDATQECFLKLAQRSTSVRTSLAGWLHRVATRCSLDLVKRESRRREREVALSPPPPIDEVSWDDIQSLVDEAIDSLPTDQREVVVRHYLEQETIAAIARSLGLSHRTVSYRGAKAVERIRARLRSAGVPIGAAVFASLLTKNAFATVPSSLTTKLGKIAISGLSTPELSRSPGAAPTSGGGFSRAVGALAVIGVAATSLAVLVSVWTEGDDGTAPVPAGSVAAVVDLPPEPRDAPLGAGDALPTDDAREEIALPIRVVWSESGEPVADARIDSYRQSRQAGAEGTRAVERASTLPPSTTNERGVARLEYPNSWDSVRVVVAHALAVQATTDVDLTRPQSSAPIVIRLDPAYIVSGRVTDATTGAPIENALIESSSGTPESSARSGQDGVYSLARNGAGETRLAVWAESYARREVALHVTERGRTECDVQLNPALEVVVRVVDTDGHAIADVEVESPEQERGGYASYGRRFVALTDANGEAVVWRDSTFRRREPKFRISKEGYTVVSVGDLRPNSDQVGRWSSRIVIEALSRSVRAIEGTVFDPDGRPVAGALVGYNDGTMSFGGETWSEYAQTSGSGAYRLEFTNRAPEILLVAYADGWAPQIRPNVKVGTPDEPTKMDFTLSESREFSGTVTDEEGIPVEGARVEAISVGTPYSVSLLLPGVPHRTVTDAPGRFSLRDVARRLRRIRVSARGYSDWSKANPSTEEELSVVLYRPGIVRGRVVDDASDEPVNQFRVRITGGTNYSSRRGVVGESFSVPDGRFVLENLYRSGTPVPFSFAVEADGYAKAELTGVHPARADAAPQHLIRLKRGTKLEGYVFDASSGDPIPNALVYLSSKTGHSDVWNERTLSRMRGVEKIVTAADGAFQFTAKNEGTLLVRAPGYQRVALSSKQWPELRGDAGELSVALSPGEVIEGILVEDGKPATGRTVRLIRLHDEDRVAEYPREAWSEDTITDAEGRFSWNDLSPGAFFVEWTVGPRVRARTETRIRERVSVTASQRSHLTIGNDRRGIELTGTLSDSGGEPEDGVEILLRPKFAAKHEQFRTRTGAGGSFVLRELPAGRFSVAVRRAQEGGEYLELEDANVTRGVRLDLETQLP